MKSTFCILLAVLLCAAGPLWGQAAPFSRGVNLSNWFQAGSPAEIPFNRYTRRDFEQIRNLGFDVVRLPINLHFMTGGEPDYALDPLFLRYLDQVVDWAEELELHLVLDNHTFDVDSDTDPAIGGVLEKVWVQMATHYKDRSDRVYYEILNEPHGIADATWNAIQQDVVAAIRTVDTEHTIVVGPANWNSFHNLEEMPVYDDDNLIYTFHFYDPFLFTHQGASWGSPNLADLAGVPFPYRAGDMPELPESLEGTWYEGAYRNYPEDGTVAAMQAALDIAIAFGQQRQVPLLLGELGVYMNVAPEADRIEWYRVMREYMDSHGLAWTMWDYHGGFGLFEKGSQGLFDHDLNVPLLEALGLEVPPQTEYIQPPASSGFDIYLDATPAGTVPYGNGAGSLDLRSADRPREGNRAIRWADSHAYGAVGFDFQPDQDLQYLADRGYGLSLAVRGDKPGLSLGLRFMDSDTADPEDRPWRMGFEIDESRVDWDGGWQRVFVPLADMQEQGAWDDGNWYGPEGRFDWSAVDRLEIATGADGLSGAVIGLDEIRVTPLQPGDPRLDNDAGASGLFFDPAAPGHGFDFNVVDGGLVVFYYGHTASGERLWLISETLGDNLAFGETIELDFYELTDGTFGAPNPPLAVWGTIRITLDDCTSGSAEFDGLDGQLNMPLVRLAGVPGLGCSD